MLVVLLEKYYLLEMYHGYGFYSLISTVLIGWLERIETSI